MIVCIPAVDRQQHLSPLNMSITGSHWTKLSEAGHDDDSKLFKASLPGLSTNGCASELYFSLLSQSD